MVMTIDADRYDDALDLFVELLAREAADGQAV
jgi:hypothetical protein